MGKIIITLADYLKAHNISKNKLTLGARMQRTQLQRYCMNRVSLIDLDVLARICDYLDCDICDIIEYHKDE